MSANKIIRLLTVFTVSAVAFIATEAGATVMQSTTFDEKVENAASIVLGKCLTTESKWDEGHRWIVTYSTFSVEKSIKGGNAQQLTVITPGGAVGDIHQDTIGVPQFTPGDERILFVKNTAVGPTVLYFDQGTYEIARGSRGERVVRPVATDALVMDDQRGMASATEAPRTIEQFEIAVRDSEKRVRNRVEMEMVKHRAANDQSIGAVLLRNRGLVALALAGIAIAAWQILRRS